MAARKPRLTVVPDVEEAEPVSPVEAVPEATAPRQRYRALQEITFVTREGNTGTIGSGKRFSTDGWIPFDPKTMERVE